MKRELLFVCCSIVGLLVTSTSGLGQDLINRQPPADSSGPSRAQSQIPKLSAGPQEVATELGLMPLLDRLYSLPESERCGSSPTLEALMLRQEISDRVLSASLEIDGVFAEIDNEIGRITAVRSELEDRRDRALKINGVAGIVLGGALGVVSTALQFKDSTAQAGNIVGVAAGAASTFLSALGIRQQRGGRLALDTETTNMLGKVFDRPPKRHSEYPDEVWTYLSAKPPEREGPENRVARLKAKWIKDGRIDADPSKASKKIELFAGNSPQPLKLSIDQLNDRAAMLHDVRLEVAFMKRDLSKLLLAVRCHQ